MKHSSTPLKTLVDNDDILVFTKEELMVGKEADIADALIDAAVEGYKTFAGHLQEPEKFLDEVKKAFCEMIDDIVL